MTKRWKRVRRKLSSRKRGREGKKDQQLHPSGI
jgi:hypothetical protein